MIENEIELENEINDIDIDDDVDTIRVIFRCIAIPKENYKKAKKLYVKRKEFKKIKPIGEVDDLLKLPLDSKWYLYKRRIFIFRKYQKIASFIITKYKVYNPLIACGGSYHVGRFFRLGRNHEKDKICSLDSELPSDIAYKKILKIINKHKLLEENRIIRIIWCD